MKNDSHNNSENENNRCGLWSLRFLFLVCVFFVSAHVCGLLSLVIYEVE